MYIIYWACVACGNVLAVEVGELIDRYQLNVLAVWTTEGGSP